ncbi:MAG: hypothetical protein U9R74_02390 [Pseudomonadota bacterium]|nr:hypothetical protein [Pseudomonadota bacterium]
MCCNFIPRRTQHHWPWPRFALLVAAVLAIEDSCRGAWVAGGWLFAGFAISGPPHPAFDLFTPTGEPLVDPSCRRIVMPGYQFGGAGDVWLSAGPAVALL